MASFGYIVSSAYASWASVNQKKLAQVRIKDHLETLMQTRETREFWRDNFVHLQTALFFELRKAEEEWYAQEHEEDSEHLANKKNILYRFLGRELCEQFLYDFSIHYDSRQIIVRLERMLTM